MAVATIEAPHRVSRFLEELYRKSIPVKDKSALQYFSANDPDVIAMILSDIRARLGISSPDQFTKVIEFLRGNDEDAIRKSEAIKQIIATRRGFAPNEVFIVTQRQGSVMGTTNAFIYVPHESGAMFTGGWSIENYEPPEAQSAEPLQAAA